MPGPQELLIVLVIVLVIFGGAKLPKLARSLGEAQKELKDAQSGTESPRHAPLPSDDLPPVDGPTSRP